VAFLWQSYKLSKLSIVFTMRNWLKTALTASQPYFSKTFCDSFCLGNLEKIWHCFWKGPSSSLKQKKSEKHNKLAIEHWHLCWNCNSMHYNTSVLFVISVPRARVLNHFWALVKPLSFPSIPNFIKFDAATFSIAPYLLLNAWRPVGPSRNDWYLLLHQVHSLFIHSQITVGPSV